MQTHLLKFQRENRKQMPAPESILWYKIRKNQLGTKFRRQYAIGNRILDFYAPQTKIGIEIDGESHYFDEKIHRKNIESDKRLEREDIKILRFLNTDVSKNLDGVILEILDSINPPSPKRGVPVKPSGPRAFTGAPSA